MAFKQKRIETNWVEKSDGRSGYYVREDPVKQSIPLQIFLDQQARIGWRVQTKTPSASSELRVDTQNAYKVRTDHLPLMIVLVYEEPALPQQQTAAHG